MTSKEALNEIKHIVDSSKRPQNFNGNKYLECMTKIEKDLEVLEILKNHFKEEYKMGNGQISFLFRTNQNDNYEKIKEWLDRKE